MEKYMTLAEVKKEIRQNVRGLYNHELFVKVQDFDEGGVHSFDVEVIMHTNGAYYEAWLLEEHETLAKAVRRANAVRRSLRLTGYEVTPVTIYSL